MIDQVIPEQKDMQSEGLVDPIYLRYPDPLKIISQYPLVAMWIKALLNAAKTSSLCKY